MVGYRGATKKLGFLAAACLATVLTAGILSGCNRSHTASAAPRELVAPTVTVVRAHKKDVPIIRTRDGTTRALNEVTIRARVKGFLQEVHFKEGVNVKKGDLLLVIEEEPYKVKVAQARAALEENEAALKKARESKSREIARARVSLDDTQLQLDRIDERRERNLIARKAASQEDYDQAKAKVGKSAAQVEADTAALEQATADYDINILSAQAKIDQAKADLRAAEIDLGYCRMYSPIDGRIGELKVKLGNLVGPGSSESANSTLATIQQLDPIGVDLRPPSRYLPIINQLVKHGLDVKVNVEGQRTHPYKGKVSFVDNTVESTTSTVLMKAEIPNPEELVLPGEYVKVELNIGDYAGGIIIPEAAVIESQEGSRVLVVDDQNKVQVVPVKPLDLYQGLAIIETGLQEGQQIIVKGLQLVRPGQTVKLEEADVASFVRPDAQSDSSSPADSPLMRIRGDASGASSVPAAGNPPESAKPPQPAPGPSSR